MPYRYLDREGTAQYFYVSNTGFKRKVVYRSFKDYKRFVGHMKLYAELPEANIVVVAFLLSNDGFQMVLKESVTGSIAKFLHKLSVSYAMYFNARYEQKGKLFAGPYKEQALHDEESAVLMATRLHKRAVLLYQNPLEYAWSSLRLYLEESDAWLHRRLFSDYFSSSVRSFPRDMVNFVDTIGP